uniref:ATP synthase peripheral stalk subunit F6, mitochondrial n=1 Tax=Pundamilia nyererei TaxID=303518 RepID=A0A3B4HBA5_9CICH
THGGLSTLKYIFCPNGVCVLLSHFDHAVFSNDQYQLGVRKCCFNVCFSDLDPVQRLFLEKIREYTNMSNAGFLEAEPDYQKNLSEETAKLQRVYGGGDLSSFPQFTFNGENPKLDQESK